MPEQLVRDYGPIGVPKQQIWLPVGALAERIGRFDYLAIREKLSKDSQLSVGVIVPHFLQGLA